MKLLLLHYSRRSKRPLHNRQAQQFGTSGKNIYGCSDFEYLEVISRGAYSVVMTARHARLDVAVKILTVNADTEMLHKLASDELILIQNAEAKLIRRDNIVEALGSVRENYLLCYQLN